MPKKIVCLQRYGKCWLLVNYFFKWNISPTYSRVENCTTDLNLLRLWDVYNLYLKQFYCKKVSWQPFIRQHCMFISVYKTLLDTNVLVPQGYKWATDTLLLLLLLHVIDIACYCYHISISIILLLLLIDDFVCILWSGACCAVLLKTAGGKRDYNVATNNFYT